MCGINGIFGLDKLQDPRSTLQRMNKCIQHRGPDASGIYLKEQVALGHQRLSIIDLSEGANQPFLSSCGRYALVFNGEIYNFRAIRKQHLTDYPFKTDSDTEVVLAAWQKWGVAAIQQFEGMFAFAIWDNQLQKLSVCRDRLGIKPLYYTFQKGSFVFSSELRAILSSDIPDRKLNREVLWDFVQYQCVHAPQTIVEDIFMLEPGHLLEVSDEEIIAKQYYQLSAPPNIHFNRNETHEMVKERFRDAVKKRLVADVPFGAFLSGGIDSSLIVSQMAEFMSQPVKTFTITFSEKAFSEAKYAQMISDKYATEHHEICLQASDLLNILPDALAAVDHPSGDGPNTFLISKVTKEAGVKMVLSGLGGDELFAGYPIFSQLSELSQKKWILSFPKVIRAMVGKFLLLKNPGIAAAKMAEVLTSSYFEIPYVYPLSRKLFTQQQIENYFGASKVPNAVFNLLQEEITFGKAGFQLPFISKISLAEMRTYMQNVLLRDTDQMSMAHALEVRVPFLDHQLVELVLQIPDYLKMGNTPKQLLVNSFKNELPAQLVNRTKMGFTFPWEHWLRNELKGFVEERIYSLNERELFKKDAILSIYKDFQSNHPLLSWSRIWHLAVLEDYINRHQLSL